MSTPDTTPQFPRDIKLTIHTWGEVAVYPVEEYAHALWGIESDADPSYIVEVANNLLRDIDWDRLWADLAAENLCHSA